MSYRALAIAAAVAAGFVAASSGARAASQVTFVSTAGTDAGTCARTAPCRTLGFAIAATSARGELHVLDSGTYGASATINRSITIEGGGNSIIALPIEINAATAKVVLRGLVLDGIATTNANGIHILAAAEVHVEHCEVYAFKQFGFYLETGSPPIFISDSSFHDNGFSGVFIGGNSAGVSIENSRFERNSNSGLIILNTFATVTRSTAASNNDDGYQSNSLGDLTIESSVASENQGSGLDTIPGAVARISNSTFVNNAVFGVSVGSGTVFSRGNNTVTDNFTANVSGSLTPLAAQ